MEFLFSPDVIQFCKYAIGFVAFAVYAIGLPVEE